MWIIYVLQINTISKFHVFCHYFVKFAVNFWVKILSTPIFFFQCTIFNKNNAKYRLLALFMASVFSAIHLPLCHTLHDAYKHLRSTTHRHLRPSVLVAYFLCEKIRPSEYIQRPGDSEGQKAWVGIKAPSSARSHSFSPTEHISDWKPAGKHIHSRLGLK